MTITRTPELQTLLEKHAGGQYLSGDLPDVDGELYARVHCRTIRKHPTLSVAEQTALAFYIALFRGGSAMTIPVEEPSGSERETHTAAVESVTAATQRQSTDGSVITPCCTRGDALSESDRAFLSALHRESMQAAFRQLILIAVLILACAAVVRAQPGRSTAGPGTDLTVQLQSNGVTIGTRTSGLLKLNCEAATFVNSVWTCTQAGATVTDPRGFQVIFSGTSAVAGSVFYVTVPYACTINNWVITATPAGTATVKLWRVADGGTAVPTVANTISTSGFSISTGTRIHSTNVSDLSSTAVAAYDTFGVNLFAAATSTQITFVLGCSR